MNCDNHAVRLHREILIRLCEMYLSGRLEERIDYLPLEMRPRDGAASRCCIHRDRALIKCRVAALLGVPIDEECDDPTPLSVHAKKARERTLDEPRSGPLLSVLSEACAGCVRERYYVTNACQGCLAKPCVLNCPKQAVDVTQGHARILVDRCVNCGKCMKVCPYHAIVHVPVPCEEACPVDALSRTDDGKQRIDPEKCIHCGKCRRACPFGAILESSELLPVLRALQEPTPTVAIVAPALAGQFNAEFGRIVTALRTVGFDYVVEAAAGADRVAQWEAEEFVEKRAAGLPILASSCCPAWVRTVATRLPAMAEGVSHTPSPMHAAAAWAKERWPDARTVFLTPCIAKRAEAAADPHVDGVLSFEELGTLLVAAGVDVESLPGSEADLPGGVDGRGFPVSGGVGAALARHIPADAEFRPKLIHGLDRKTIRLLSMLPRTAEGANYLEVMACEGGCVGGPSVLCNPSVATKRIAAATAEAATREAAMETSDAATTAANESRCGT